MPFDWRSCKAFVFAYSGGLFCAVGPLAPFTNRTALPTPEIRAKTRVYFVAASAISANLLIHGRKTLFNFRIMSRP